MAWFSGRVFLYLTMAGSCSLLLLLSLLLIATAASATSLDELENARKKVSGKSTKLYNQMLEAHKKSKELDSTFKELTKEIQSISKEKVASEKQRKSALKKHAQLELDTQDLEEKISGGDRAKVDAEKQLKNLQKEIQDSEKELNEARPEYNKKLGVEEKIKKRIMEYEKELSILYQKQGRTTQFASKTDLDKWLQKEIDDYQRVLSANQLQKQFSELLMKAASDYGALTASVADVQWSQNFVTTYSMGDVAGMDKAAHQLQLTLEESNT